MIDNFRDGTQSVIHVSGLMDYGPIIACYNNLYSKALDESIKNDKKHLKFIKE